MELVGVMRVKNEARWIDVVVDSIRGCCDRIVVMDDHSTDDTAAICRAHGAEMLTSPFQGLDEGRDKQWLIEQIGRPDWVLMIDGDEVLEPGGGEVVRELCESATVTAYSLRIRYLWNSTTQVRVDGIYGRFYRPSLWKFEPDQRFMRTSNGGGFHCSSTPVEAARRLMRVDRPALLHLGYMDQADRLRKFEWYNRQAPVPAVEDGYRHMVIGDLLPADAQTRWAGPLRIEEIPAW